MNDTISIKKTGKQILVFLFFLFLIFFFLFKGKDVSQILKIAASASFPAIVAGIAMAGAFNLSEGLNLGILLKAMGHKVSFAQGMKYAYMGFFFSSITPSSTGGQPMQLYAMKKDGIDLSHGSLALLMELASFQAMAFLFELFAVAMIPVLGISLPVTIKILIIAGFIMNAAFVAFLLVVIFSERMGQRIFGLVKKILPRLPFVKEETKSQWIRKMEEGLLEFHACALLMKEHKKAIAKMCIISAGQIICWFGVPYMVYLALGYQGSSFLHIFVLQILIYMSSSLLPLPGAMGISEYAFLQLFGSIYSGSSMTAAVLLSRGISFYFLLALSGIMLLLIYGAARQRKCNTIFS